MSDSSIYTSDEEEDTEQKDPNYVDWKNMEVKLIYNITRETFKYKSQMTICDAIIIRRISE